MLVRRRRLAAAALIGAAVLGPTARAHAQPADEPKVPPPFASTDDIARLRAELDALRAEQAKNAEAARAAEAHATEVEAELVRERAAREAERADRPGFVIAAGHAKISVGAFVQVDAVLHDQASSDELDPSTREPLNQDRLILRRGRVRIDVDGGLIAGKLELDANTIHGPQLRVIGAEVSARIPWKNPDRPALEAVAGLFRIPFGLETRQPYQERLFLEEGNATRALFPGDYDLGLGVRASWRWLRAQAAWMNGDPMGEKGFPGRDPNGAKDVVGRIALAVGRAPGAAGQGAGVEIGMSATSGRGFHAGQASTKDVLVWRDDNQDGLVDPSELYVLPGQTAQASEDFYRFAIGADVRATWGLGRWGEAQLYGEVIRGSNLDRGLFVADPVSAGRQLRELGLMAAATWQSVQGGQVGVRWDRYDPDQDAFEQQAGTIVPRNPIVGTLAIAAGWRLRGSGRALLEYDHETNPFGRDAGGEPTTLASDSLTLRLEGAF